MQDAGVPVVGACPRGMAREWFRSDDGVQELTSTILLYGTVLGFLLVGRNLKYRNSNNHVTGSRLHSTTQYLRPVEH